MYYTGNYKSDREFTDFVHTNLACKIIYPKLNWEIQDLNLKMLNNIDTRNAIDKNIIKTVTIQERFREKKYSNYTDFTIRYKRDHNQFDERKLSEYFKLDADYFVYGIIDESKANVYKAKSFLKYCVIDINKIKEYIDLEKIIIRENTNLKKCIIENNKLICPVIENRDYSSSFFPIDIVMLSMLFEDDNIIVLQEGFK